MKILYILILIISVLFIPGCKNYSDYPELLLYKTPYGSKKPVKTYADMEIKRQQILDSMQMAMGKLPDRAGLPAPVMHITDSIKEKNYTRLTITILIRENDTATAYLYVPDPNGKHEKLPAMLALHGTGALGKKFVDGQGATPNRAYAKELAERGYVVIAPDYPSMGDQLKYDFAKDQYESGTMKGIFNHIRCLDLLETFDYVDPDRMGVIGHSLGGHNAMFVGAFDSRLRVVVSSCGWTPFAYYDIGEEASKRFGGRLGAWAQDRYMPLLRDKYRLDGNIFPFDFNEVITAIAPRAFFSNSPLNDSNFDVNGVKKGISEALEVYHFFKAEDHLQVRYPQAEHDFPPETRLEAFHFIDKVLEHTPADSEIK